MLIEGDLILADFKGGQHLAAYKGTYEITGAHAGATGGVVLWSVEARWNGQARAIGSEQPITSLQASGVQHHVRESIVRTIKAVAMRHRDL